MFYISNLSISDRNEWILQSCGISSGATQGSVLYSSFTQPVFQQMDSWLYPPLPRAEEVTFLGVHLDRRITWSTHFEAKQNISKSQS